MSSFGFHDGFEVNKWVRDESIKTIKSLIQLFFPVRMCLSNCIFSKEKKLLSYIVSVNTGKCYLCNNSKKSCQESLHDIKRI